MHTETGIYSLSHQMVGTNTDMITRLESLEQSMRNSLALADQLTALREQVQEIVRMIFDQCRTGSFAHNFFQTIFVVYNLNSFWLKKKVKEILGRNPSVNARCSTSRRSMGISNNAETPHRPKRWRGGGR